MLNSLRVTHCPSLWILSTPIQCSWAGQYRSTFFDSWNDRQQIIAFGVFQDFYTSHLLSQRSASEVSWIGSTQLCLNLGLGVIAAHLVDWTDPRKVVNLDTIGEEVIDDGSRRKTIVTKVINSDVHLNLARDVLEKVNSSTCNSMSLFLSLCC